MRTVTSGMLAAASFPLTWTAITGLSPLKARRRTRSTWTRFARSKS